MWSSTVLVDGISNNMFVVQLFAVELSRSMTTAIQMNSDSVTDKSKLYESIFVVMYYT